MKKTEKKVRDEISRVVINYLPKAGKRYIGKVFVEMYKYGDELWIDCIYSGVIFARLVIDSEDVVRRVIVGKKEKELTQLRLLLEKLKR